MKRFGAKLESQTSSSIADFIYRSGLIITLCNKIEKLLGKNPLGEYAKRLVNSKVSLFQNKIFSNCSICQIETHHL